MFQPTRAPQAADESGQSLIEFALCLPALLLLLLGIVTFGLTMNNYMIITEATGIGARQIAVSRQQTLDPCQVASSAIIAASPTLTTSNFSFSYSFNGVAYSGTSCPAPSNTTGSAGNLQQGKPAVVTVTYPCKLSIGTWFAWAGPCNLTAQTTEVVQ